MNTRLDGRTALVCGASQGIGAETARVLASLGAQVVLVARDEKNLAAVKKTLAGQGHESVSLDLSDEVKLRDVLDQLVRKHDFDILINNAGGPKSGAITDADSKEFLAAFKTHIIASQILVQKLMPGMKKKNYGRVINIISTSVKIPLPMLGVSNTIRGAMASWSKTMANELGPFGITVNNVLPGFTKTERLESLKKATADRSGKETQAIEAEWIQSVPLRRLAEPVEIANVIGFLAGPSASYISGVNIPVDGGRLGSM